jgi:hypothetical protein
MKQTKLIYKEVGLVNRYICQSCKKTTKIYVLYNSKLFKLVGLCKACIEKKHLIIK